jgi:hypothetical protein
MVSHIWPRVRGGRLVEEDQRRPGDQAGGEVQAAAHAAGELGDRLVGGLLEAELFEQSAGGGARGGRAQPLQPAEHPQVLERREALVDRGVLAGDADQLADAVRLPGDVHPEDPGLPGVDGEQRGEHAQRGGLAGPVRTEHAEDLPLAHLEVDPVDRAEPAEILHQAGRVNSGGVCHLICLPRGEADTMRR